MFVGSVLYPSPRIDEPRSKYYVSEKLWPEKYYPPYVSGGGFIMSYVMAIKIFEERFVFTRPSPGPNRPADELKHLSITFWNRCKGNERTSNNTY